MDPVMTPWLYTAVRKYVAKGTDTSNVAADFHIGLLKLIFHFRDAGKFIISGHYKARISLLYYISMTYWVSLMC